MATPTGRGGIGSRSTAARCERWVLPDWYGAGGYLEISSERPRLVRW